VSDRRRFRIKETLGRGGFGTVYRAEMSDAGDFAKEVALKVLHYEGEAADDIARRLRDEARVLGLIRHRAVVGVNSLVPLKKGWGVVMEYIDGSDLSRVLKHGAVPIGAAVTITEEVAAALDAAYNTVNHLTSEPLRLIHRDIKPSNIRITLSGDVKLLDFGVATADFLNRESTDGADYVMGSLRYMAPERHEGSESPKGDVYGLGIVLANLLTGKRFPEPPVEPREHASFLTKILETVRTSLGQSESPQIKTVVEQLVQLLLQMLAYESADRPDARTVERRCRRISGRLPPPYLRDWSETSIVRLVEEHRNRPRDDEHDTGLILLERTGEYLARRSPETEGLDAIESDEEVTESSRDTEPHTSHRLGLAMALGALLGAGLVGILWLLSGAR
jgi:serine/threonine protein kinase